MLAAAAMLILDVALGPRAFSIPVAYAEKTTHLAVALLLTAVILAVHKLA